jgi:hypothetical protein
LASRDDLKLVDVRQEGHAWNAGASHIAAYGRPQTNVAARCTLISPSQARARNRGIPWAKEITLTNKGDAAVSITSIVITGTDSGDFAETNNCGKQVASGGTCFIKVTFKPLRRL